MKGDNRRSDYCLLYVDLFDLKKINDTQGDAYGSRYIQRCAKAISGAMYRKEKMFRAGSRRNNDVASAYDEVYRSRDGGDEFFIIINGKKLDSLYALRRLLVDLLEIKKDLRKLSTADGNPIVDFNVGFRAGIVELGNYTSRESAVAEVKSALFHARKQDLPGSPSKYVVLGTQPHLLSEQKRKLMVDFDRLVEGGCTKG